VNRDIDGIPLQEAAAGRTILARGQKTAKSAAVPRCIDSSSLIASGALLHGHQTEQSAEHFHQGRCSQGLHSLSGTMAISETTLKDTVLMLIDEQNKKGGLLGKKLEAVVVDPASNWPLFAEKAAS
jgi:hypothetical protein